MDDEQQDIQSLNDLLDLLDETAGQQEKISVGDVVDMMGRRWFAPLLLVSGLIIMLPGVGDIPGVPVAIGLLVILISVQSVMHRRRVWLPGWLRQRSVSCNAVKKSVRLLRKPAGWIEKVTRPRQEWAVHHAGAYIVAATSILVAATTPILEFIPFSATVAGTAIASFGLALLVRDGLFAILAIILSLGTIGSIAYPFL